MFTLLLPPGVNPIAVYKYGYIIPYISYQYHWSYVFVYLYVPYAGLRR